MEQHEVWRKGNHRLPETLEACDRTGDSPSIFAVNLSVWGLGGGGASVKKIFFFFFKTLPVSREVLSSP